MRDPFAHLPRTPESHFTLYFYAALLQIQERVVDGVEAAPAMEQFPFLQGYFEQIDAALSTLRIANAPGRSAQWWEAVREWERADGPRLPLVSLHDATGLEPLAITLLFCSGLVEEDARFGPLFEALGGTPGWRRPTAGMLTGWWPDQSRPAEVRQALHALLSYGLLEVPNSDAPHAEWAVQPSPLVWQVIRGDVPDELAPWLRHRAPSELASTDDLIVADGVASRLTALAELVTAGVVRTVIIRGPRGSGRRTVLGAMARSLGRGILVADLPATPDDHRWRLFGAVATLTHSVPVLVLDPGPGESIDLPELRGCDAPLGITLGMVGGIGGRGSERSITINVDMPTYPQRRRHWEVGFGTGPAAPLDDLDDLSERLRMTGGNIRRVASMAAAEARLEGRAMVTAADVQGAGRTLNRQVLDTLANRVDAFGRWDDLVVGDETSSELLLLESRCRLRERLQLVAGPAIRDHRTNGVVSLFAGPSGTGKTLAARVLASVLQKDLYRIDLSTVVNKYLGETEKNLSSIFSRAEELDVIILLDEGDALLTRRTDVQTSNDRYANLETNYLLQRLETFDGILIVTTNVGERIDSAFQRRMDVVIDFRLPEPMERWSIWQLHLPSDHEVEGWYLQDVAGRCGLTGGQIRNAALHASLLALTDRSPITVHHVDTAIRREYRKTGSVCPLRSLDGKHA